MINFDEMEIDGEIKAALTDMEFTTPTPIQAEVIPLILGGQDVIAQAPTGTGKTCAFGIPIINKIDPDNESVQAIVLCPTRELVIQTEAELKSVAKYNKDIRILSIYGGQNFDRQLSGLRKRPQIVVGTTGRVMDHLRRRTLKLGELKILVLDEVDEMLDMGFREDIDVILETAPKERQTVLFSATMPKEIVEISKRYQNQPISIKTQHEKSDIPNINQYYVNTDESEKIGALVSILRQKNYSLSLVFCNTKKRVDELNAHLLDMGLCSDALHGDLKQRDRDKTMRKFRSGETQILIATDVAARGIDVDNIKAVFNFDIPHDEDSYVHRIGRTARANEVGDAYTFVSPKQLRCIKDFERYTKNPILRAEVVGEEPQKGIDEKLFQKTMQLVKKGDLAMYKEYIEAELAVLDEKYNADALDVAAALLLQLGEAQNYKNAALSKPPSTKADRKGKELSSPPARAGRKDKGGVKFFMNIGTRDNCDPDSVTKFISSKTGIGSSDILGVDCLESFSFASVKDGFNDMMESLNGLKFNKRILAVEVAGGDKGAKKPAKYANSPVKSGRPSAGKSYGDKPYGDKPAGRTYGDKPAGRMYSDKPAGRSYGDKPSAGKTYGDKPAGKTYGDKPFGGKSFNDTDNKRNYEIRKSGKPKTDVKSGFKPHRKGGVFPRSGK